MVEAHNPPPFIVYRKIPAFVGHSFAQKDRSLVESLKDLLSALGLECDTGEKPSGGSISKKILDRIDRNEIFVGIFTRKSKLADDKKWTTSSWVVEEKVAAIDKGKRLLLLVEDGVDDIGGLQGDYEYVRFTRQRLYESLTKITQYVSSMTTPTHPVQIGIPSDAARTDAKAIVRDLREGAVNPDRYAAAAQEMQETRQFADAEKLLRDGLAKFPDVPELKYQLANVLRRREKKEESESLFREIIELDPSSPRLHHNFAHLLEDVGKTDEALNHFQTALDNHPTPENFRCYGMCLYRKSISMDNPVVRRETLKKAKRLLENSIRLQLPEKGDIRAQGYLMNIESCLADVAIPEPPTNE